MKKERMHEVICNILEWGAEHSDEFFACLIDASDLTLQELSTLGFEKPEGEDDE